MNCAQAEPPEAANRATAEPPEATNRAPAEPPMSLTPIFNPITQKYTCPAGCRTAYGGSNAKANAKKHMKFCKFLKETVASDDAQHAGDLREQLKRKELALSNAYAEIRALKQELKKERENRKKHKCATQLGIHPFCNLPKEALPAEAEVKTLYPYHYNAISSLVELIMRQEPNRNVRLTGDTLEVVVKEKGKGCYWKSIPKQSGLEQLTKFHYKLLTKHYRWEEKTIWNSFRFQERMKEQVRSVENAIRWVQQRQEEESHEDTDEE